MLGEELGQARSTGQAAATPVQRGLDSSPGSAWRLGDGTRFNSGPFIQPAAAMSMEVVSLATRLPSAFQIKQEVREGNARNASDQAQIQNRDVALTAVDRADEGPVQVALLGQLNHIRKERRPWRLRSPD